MNFLKKIQNLPERKRKIIFWSLMVIITAALATFYFKNFQKRLESFEIEKMKEEIPKLEIEIPEIDSQELEKLKEQIKEFNP